MNAKRIELIDIIRGVALIGILFANIGSIARLDLNTDLDKQIYRFTHLVFEQRFFPIFSLLFGTGFFIFMRNAEKKGLPNRILMVKRLVILILFGVLHHLIQPGEALLIYGILGFFILLSYRLSNAFLFALFLITLLLGVFVIEYFIVLSMFYLGFLLGKIDFFNDTQKYNSKIRMSWITSLLLAGPLIYLQISYIQSIDVSTYFMWLLIAGLDIAVLIVTSLLLWSKAEVYLKPLAAFGRMALTNYIMQSILVFLVALIWRSIDSASLTMIAIPIIWLPIWIGQIILSNVWMRHFHYGPLEWLWRWGTYGRKPQFVKNEI